MPGDSLTLPLRLAFYYASYPEAWTQGTVYPFTNYTPALGYYDSSDASVIRQHIASMQYGHIQGGIVFWSGISTPSDTRFPGVLAAASGIDFKWALYYQPEASGDPSSSAIASDLGYIFKSYAVNPGYLRIGGKPVLFVSGGANDGCATADRWKTANTLGFYVVLKVFSGYPNCANQPDNWHQYGPAQDYDVQGSHAVSISPGFWQKGQAVVLARDLARWNQDIRNMLAAHPDFQLITTWNGWCEGTQVESSTELGAAYLEALHNNGASGPDPVVMAAGDIVCPDLITTSTDCQQMAVSQLLVDQNPDTVLVLGDQCQSTSANCFNNYYGPSWGRVFSKSHPVPGNHEYGKTGAQYYFDYWDGIGGSSGPAGDRGKGYYSFDQGTWHIIALNSECTQIGGCGAASPEYTWLQQDLQLHPSQCTLAFWHRPLFGSTSLISTDVRPFWQLLYDNNADVILDGHSHTYERFAPQDPNALADPLRGIREFIVGTGGAFHTGIGTIAANSEVRNATTFGTLKLTLHAGRYDWQFLPIAGQTFTDAGTGYCH